MKKFNQTGLVIVSILAVLMYFRHEQTPSKPVNANTGLNFIPVVLKNHQDELIPFTIKSACSTQIECLNESVVQMSSNHGSYEATLPLNAKVVSLDCGDVCIADFNEKIMEFDPVDQHQVEQVLSYILHEYSIQKITVNQKESTLHLKEPLLNHVNFIDADLHQGKHYQMVMVKDDVLIPVVVRSNSSDFHQVLKEFYENSSSVQFDTENFQSLNVVMNETLELHLSADAMFQHELLMNDVMPVLFSLQYYYPNERVKIYVEDVFVEEILLNELTINENKLSDS